MWKAWDEAGSGLYQPPWPSSLSHGSPAGCHTGQGVAKSGAWPMAGGQTTLPTAE